MPPLRLKSTRRREGGTDPSKRKRKGFDEKLRKEQTARGSSSIAGGNYIEKKKGLDEHRMDLGVLFENVSISGTGPSPKKS